MGLFDSLRQPAQTIETETQRKANTATRVGGFLRLLLDRLEEVFSTFVPKEPGKGLSDANFTLEEKQKLGLIAPEANKYVLPSVLPATIIQQTAEYRFVTDDQIATWDAAGGTVVNTTTNKKYRWEGADLSGEPDANGIITKILSLPDTMPLPLAGSFYLLSTNEGPIGDALSDGTRSFTVRFKAGVTNVDVTYHINLNMGEPGPGTGTGEESVHRGPWVSGMDFKTGQTTTVIEGSETLLFEAKQDFTSSTKPTVGATAYWKEVGRTPAAVTALDYTQGLDATPLTGAFSGKLNVFLNRLWNHVSGMVSDAFGTSTTRTYSQSYINSLTKRVDQPIFFAAAEAAPIPYEIPASSPTPILTIQGYKAAAPVTSLSYQLRKGDGTLGTETTSTATVNAEINALTAQEKEFFEVLVKPNTAGYSVLVKSYLSAT